MYKHSLSSLRGWLFALFIGVSLGFFLLGGIGLVGNYHGERSLQSLYNDQVVPLHRIQVLTENYGMQVQNTILRLDAGELTADEGATLIRAAQDSVEASWAAYRGSEHDSIEKRLIHRLDSARVYADLEIANTLRYIEIQQAMGNRLLANQLYAIAGSLNPSVRPVLGILDTLGSVHLLRAQREYRHEARRAGAYLFATLVLVVVGMLIGPVVGMHTLRRINRQLDAILPALSRMAQGDLQVRIVSEINDEMGLIGDGINRMAQSLQEIVGQMGADSAALAQTSMELSTIARHAYEDAKNHVEQTKATAGVAKDIAVRLESGLELLVEPAPHPDSLRQLRNALLTMRNEKMVAVVQGLASTRTTAVQSARGMDLLQHKAQFLSQMSDRLALRIRKFSRREL